MVRSMMGFRQLRARRTWCAGPPTALTSAGSKGGLPPKNKGSLLPRTGSRVPPREPSPPFPSPSSGDSNANKAAARGASVAEPAGPAIAPCWPPGARGAGRVGGRAEEGGSRLSSPPALSLTHTPRSLGGTPTPRSGRTRGRDGSLGPTPRPPATDTQGRGIRSCSIAR